MGVELSREAKWRLEWIDWYRAHGRNARKTCRHFSISPDTLYRWLGRYDPKDLTSLEDCVRPLPGVVLKHYTGRDMASLWDVVGVYSRATATRERSFLGQLIDRMPFEVRAIQSLPRNPVWG